ncbi:hypothetical protein BASA50_008931 [Batrachochytrium salamandrivorans]|uniref:Protein FRA10AC1 n=1 Tax=Batrachochytrium salamandrivorans TaxID=1357716 RepID=A0ABQ8F2C0_9FUNG|nr:hypothetical protein BASA62_005570 [Batrachochytrium salamandrivorans]KAH6590931.1 hypothetical protein BASA50_008931 [Batrachochytrium salamandrivorans]KAH9268530.1 hypothetical protein BASA84_000135 [Batrachochytrium salamandrivorans]
MNLPKTSHQPQGVTGTSIAVSDLSTYFALPLRSDSSNAHTSTLNNTSNKPAMARNVFTQQHDSGLNAFQRHQKLVNDYLANYAPSRSVSRSASTKPTNVTEADILKHHHRFLRSEEDDAENTWETRIAKKYYDKLFKEYCLAELKLYKEGKIAMRWRIQQEVISGKGQFECGNLKCNSKDKLQSWEVNFAYMEDDNRKNALVKLRLCPDCTYKLHYRKIKRQREEDKRAAKELKKRARSDHQEHDRDKEEKDLSSGRKEVRGDGSTSEREIDNNTDSNHQHANLRNRTDHGDTSDPQALLRKEASRIWSAPIQVETEDDIIKTRQEEFDDYFADLLL